MFIFFLKLPALQRALRALAQVSIAPARVTRGVTRTALMLRWVPVVVV